ncbi:MAG: cyclomaltodextrinase N-terminal domain-containing protein [Sphingobacteriales bacterium]|nr:cyclomaltodextrinase N-terminal domain-containing protein [Sphingobacteriales bacterium]MBP9140687.1 cyclomaltodextrinase N-terminal domain-containing protein [Chitinophagales bacterium]MDA0198890.1 alpha-amylase family glycosyl hydrolase [Bacteroidota bacterium]MBK6889119.1 cyclomaltodextrinase N-terminal domain-containing protein [Sphingobacteriales bacterium]MBK7528379.1 cyclomaltodextrinase N-terminal domain-containing protein [Sphingobacteriales bacterium]
MVLKPLHATANNEIWQVCPPSWWVGMANLELQVLIYGKEISKARPNLKNYPDADLTSTMQLENPDYLVLNLRIKPNAKPGNLLISLQFPDKSIRNISFPIEARGEQPQAITPADVMYLLMPDRFANGNPANDIVKGTSQSAIFRDSIFARHGGDLQGVLNKLEYLQDLGVSALWMNPFLENDQPFQSYHGYAITNHYATDPRLGNNQLALDLANEAQKKDIKLVLDLIFNHIGSNHFLYKSPPQRDFFHWHPNFARTNYRAHTLFDPYAAKQDAALFLNGWFDHHMPDLNQDNPILANYLIQNTIWWIEFLHADGLRLDTYAYSSPTFLQKWGDAVFKHYPDLHVFGETWVQGEGVQAYFAQNILQTSFKSRIKYLTDFQFYQALNHALTTPFNWDDGVCRLYHTMAKDYLYLDPSLHVIFADNHDVSRFLSVVNEDFDKFKMGMGLLFTMRGVPCLYYGTEILMKNLANPDGLVRSDFPGGWQDDPVNKFTAEGRTSKENEAFNYIRSLARWHSQNEYLKSGNLKMTQFIPVEGVYVYGRYNSEYAFLTFVNSNDKPYPTAFSRYEECLGNLKSGRNIITNETVLKTAPLVLPPLSTTIIEFKN